MKEQAMTEVTPTQAEVDLGDAFWRVHPSEIIATGMTRAAWYSHHIAVNRHLAVTTALAAQAARVAGPINYEELSIQHGQQVTVSFKDSADAFALFNEIKSRAALQEIEHG